MILYQLAKWMEERAGYMEHLKDTAGDITFFSSIKKEQLEETIISQTNEWMTLHSIYGAPSRTAGLSALDHEIG